jgi:hypothetical protein
MSASLQARQIAPVDLADVIHRIVGDGTARNQSPSEPGRSILPTLSVNPVTGVSAGVVASVATRHGIAGGPVSSLQGAASVTTEGQAIVSLRSDWRRSSRWSLVGDVRFAKYMQQTYGVGGATPADARADLTYDWIRLHQTAYRRVAGSVEAGGGVHVDRQAAIEARDGGSIPEYVTPAPTEVASGVSATVRLDSRDNALNAERGAYSRISYFAYLRSLGSNGHWQSLQADGRAYYRIPSGRRQVVGAWLMAWSTVRGDPSYLNMPAIGWDTYGRSGRGYVAGRFRGYDWLYGEVEYRTDLLPNGFIGAVAFVNVSAFTDAARRFGPSAPGGGAGVRIKMDKRNGTNLALDFGWGRDGSRGVWFGLNEAF